MWVSVSGAAAQSQAVDTVANNLANADTLGFKKDQPTFKEYLSTIEREHAGEDIPRGPIKNRELYPLDGKDQSFVVVDGTYTNYKQGAMKVTQSPMDVAMDGPGMLEVSTPQGNRFTRQGSLKLAVDGNLVTSEGYPVLSAAQGGLSPSTPGSRAPASALSPGDPAAADRIASQAAAETAGRFINLRDRGSHITITQSGELYAGDQLVAKLALVEFQDLGKLRKVGGGAFESKDPSNVIPPQHTIIRQGVIEGSNVNPIEEMTNLIKANRLFEEDLKALKTYGELLGREANDIGKL